MRHIRDLMLGTLENISEFTMCGDSKAEEYAIPDYADCQRCINRWNEEKAKDKTSHYFRVKMHGVLTGGRDMDYIKAKGAKPKACNTRRR